jgi:hypothetical protein
MLLEVLLTRQSRQDRMFQKRHKVSIFPLRPNSFLLMEIVSSFSDLGLHVGSI